MGCLGTGVDGLQRFAQTWLFWNCHLVKRSCTGNRKIGKERTGKSGHNPILAFIFYHRQGFMGNVEKQKSVTDMLNKGFEDDSSLMILKVMAKKQRKGKVLEVWTDGSCYAKHP